jgi:hypothetical protein
MSYYSSLEVGSRNWGCVYTFEDGWWWNEWLIEVVLLGARNNKILDFLRFELGSIIPAAKLF